MPGVIESKNPVEMWTKSFNRPSDMFEQKEQGYQKFFIESGKFKWIKLNTGEIVPALMIKPFSVKNVKIDDIFRFSWRNEKTDKAYRLTSTPGS